MKYETQFSFFIFFFSVYLLGIILLISYICIAVCPSEEAYFVFVDFVYSHTLCGYRHCKCLICWINLVVLYCIVWLNVSDDASSK